MRKGDAKKAITTLKKPNTGMSAEEHRNIEDVKNPKGEPKIANAPVRESVIGENSLANYNSAIKGKRSSGGHIGISLRSRHDGRYVGGLGVLVYLRR
jgi:hypothetical protein